MKKKMTFFISAVQLVFFSIASEVKSQFNLDMYQSYSDFTPTRLLFDKKSVPLMDEIGRISLSADVLLQSIEKDELGFEHYRYVQTYKGLAVQHAVYILHVKNGVINSANGKFIRQFPENLAATTSISEATALNIAINNIGAREYMWQDTAAERFIKQDSGDPLATYFPKGQLVFYSSEPDVVPSQLRLAYKFDIYAKAPISRQDIFIDALTGRVLGKEKKIHLNCYVQSKNKSALHQHTSDKKDIGQGKSSPANVIGIAATAYSGAQQIITTKIDNQLYVLRDATRGKGIQTLNMKWAGAHYYKALDFVDDNNMWNNVNANLDQYATDAHWGAQKTYDYFKNKFNRNSIDNKGFALKNYVHTDLTAQPGYYSNINAFWDGSRMIYGDGGITDDNIAITPITCLETVAHEITHGLTDFTSDLVYEHEPGALNEGFSDIFGTAIEFYAKPDKANWTVGDDIGKIFRNMSNPNANENPDTYNGIYWHTDEESDKGGVHHNSAVLGYWFYLLSQGGEGVNDHGVAYEVKGIGIEKAAAIAYRLNAFYLTPTSKYFDARNLSVKAAIDLYGMGSNEVLQNAKAWLAVGIGTEEPVAPCTDVYESNGGMGNGKITTANKIPVNDDLIAKINWHLDKDFYTFKTSHSKPKLKIDLYNLPADYNLYLYNSDGALIKSSLNSGIKSESIVYNDSEEGETYYIEVNGYNQAYSKDSCYMFRISTGSKNFYDPNIKIKLPEPEDSHELSTRINKGVTKINSLSVYPNPITDNRINVHFISDNNAIEQLTFTDLTGKILFTKNINLFSGRNNVSVLLPNIAKGIYLIRIKNSTAKISIQ